MRSPSLFKRASAEALGTFALVTGGCGAILVNHATGALGHGGVAASFGLVIMVMIAALGHLSGAPRPAGPHQLTNGCGDPPRGPEANPLVPQTGEHGTF